MRQQRPSPRDQKHWVFQDLSSARSALHFERFAHFRNNLNSMTSGTAESLIHSP